MSLPDKTSTDSLIAAFNALPFDFAEVSLDEFVAKALGWNPSQIMRVFPDRSAPTSDERHTFVARLAGALDSHRRTILQTEARISFGVLIKRIDDQLQTVSYSVLGLGELLKQNGESEDFRKRAAQYAVVRDYLTGIGDGFRLECLASCVLKVSYQNCLPTVRSFDQGIDCIAGQEILALSNWCCEPDMLHQVHTLGEKLHIIASCKANEGNVPSGVPKTISPAHVRELIGAWMIQRSENGMWHQKAGIKILSPLQLLLVTTYRLSDDTLSLCRRMGVAVWSIAELAYLICRHAPVSVFPASDDSAFKKPAMDDWVDTAEALRIT